MVTEFIKRNQKMGFDGDRLVYKIPETAPTPEAIIVETVVIPEENVSIEPEVTEEV